MVWSNEQLLHWHNIYENYVVDESLVALHRNIDQQRQCVQQEMLQLLNAFLAGELRLKAFNAVFQQKTHGAWNIFRIRGTSGGMFFNKLVKYIPDEDHFTQLLRVVLHLPKDIKEGHWRMQAFLRFLEGIIASGQATRGQLQPAHTPFFLSVWWHLQAPEQWPISHLLVRNLITGEEVEPEVLQDPVEKYFAFRARFVSLASDLGLTSWETEHLFTWHGQKHLQINKRDQKNTTSGRREHERAVLQPERASIALVQVEAGKEPTNVVANKLTTSPAKRYASSRHNRVQWLLAKLGRKVGCQVWIRSTDHDKIWQNERLGTLSIPVLPALAEPSLQQVIEQIDVLWLFNNEIIAAYEIEQAHIAVAASLLCLFDVGTLASTNNTHLCLVIPQDLFGQVHSELQRPVFQRQALQQPCVVIGQEVLLQHAEHILRWARNLFVIDDLASLSTVNGKDESALDQRLADREAQKRGA